MKRKITIRMPKDDLAAWLAALRAPENQGRQGTGSLFSPKGGYCCLGVAQCIKTGGYLSFGNDDEDDEFDYYPSKKWLRSVGWRFRDQYGNLVRNPYIPMFGMTASEVNDDMGKTFAEIADAIEDCAEGY